MGLIGGLNTYSYANDNPLTYTDPSGQFFWIPVIIVGGGAVVGGYEEGHKAYECGARGWTLAKAIGRGSFAGGLGAVAGLATELGSENPYAAGAMASTTYDATNSFLGGNVSFGQTAKDAAAGAVFGGFAAEVVPAVRGGWNFNPWTSPRTFGPRALQLYGQETIGHALDMLKGSNGKSCGCQ